MKVLVHASLDHKEYMLEAKEYIESNSEHKVLLPELTRYQHIRDVLGDDKAFTQIKNRLTKDNIKNAEKCDALFILNPTHRGICNYIGGNSFLEMVIAFYLKKPIFVLNPLPNDMPYSEEIKALFPQIVYSYSGLLKSLEQLE